jgi:hypothetical protein
LQTVFVSEIANCGNTQTVAPQCLRFGIAGQRGGDYISCCPCAFANASTLRSTKLTIAQLPLNPKKAHYLTSINMFKKVFAFIKIY